MQIRRGTALATLLGVALGPGAGCALAPEEGDEAQAEAVGELAAPIVGGSPTTLYPAVPLLYSEFSQQDGAQLCSGTVISPHVILTAAHCVEFPDGPPSQYVAYFGSNVTVESDPQRIGAVNIASYTFDPAWDINNLEAGHDIGLVVLSQAAPVPPMAYNRGPIEDLMGQQVHLVGWGRTSGAGEDVGVKREVMSALQQATPMLMRYGSATANTCQGDSGGPNFMNIDGVEAVAGITSFGNAGCDQYGYGTRVDAFAASFIDPFVAQHDPTYVIPSVGGGEAPGGDGGGDDGAAGDEGGSDSEPVTGGCAAGGDVGSRPLWLGLVVLLAAGVRRRRR
jgi:MYXO-CTERM domain-containing protein